MAHIQRTIFFLCIANVYAASINNLSEENLSREIDGNFDSDLENLGQITDFDPLSPNFISERTPLNGFQMGKSLVQALLDLFQILREMNLSQDNLKNVSQLVAGMVSMFAGQYYETLKKLAPVFSGIAIAFLETLR